MVGGGVKEVTLTPENAGQYMFLFKVVLIGTENVGKTCFLKRFVDKTFDESYTATIGVDFATKTFETGHGDLIKMQAWDTAGQERFRTITNSYYRGAQGVILMYDVTNRNSFEQLPQWLDQIETMTREDRIVVLVGNKADANDIKRQVTSQEGKKFADEQSMMFFEASARDDTNVTNVFQELCEMMLDRHKSSQKQNTAQSTAPGPVDITMPGPFQKVRGGKKQKGKGDVSLHNDSKKESKLCLI